MWKRDGWVKKQDEDFISMSVKFEITNKIGILTINRPEALNALNSEVLSLLDQEISKIEKLDFSELQLLIITGSGEKSFVAGADIKQMSQLGLDAAESFSIKGQALFNRIEGLKIPVVGAINGFALGGGLELALSCDYLYCSEKAKLGLPEVGLGLLPGFTGTYKLQQKIGTSRARELIFSGRMIDAEEAKRIGLCIEILPQSQFLEAVITKCKAVCEKSPLAISKAKKSMMTSLEAFRTEALKAEALNFRDLFSSQDMIEGTSAFLEKRKPVFKGK